MTSEISFYRLLKHPGFTIAFIGTDGSGKSTIINKISPILNQAFHKSIFYEHMRPNKLPSLAKLFGKRRVQYSCNKSTCK